MALKKNTWKLNQWYDQDVAGNISYSTTLHEAWTWGNNQWGQLAQNTNNNAYSSPVQIPGTNWAYIGVKDNNALGVKTDGTLWGWGLNEKGQLGQNNKTSYSSPVQIPGTDWSSDWGKLSGRGYGVTGAIKTNGELWIWGYNAKGQLGQNNTTEYSSPKQVGSETTWNIYSNSYEGSYGIKTDGTLWSWGRNNNGTNSGVLGHNNQTQYSSPKQIPGTTWATISTAGGFVMASKTDGTLWAWGSNAYGSLGMDNSTLNVRYSSPVQVGTDTTWSTSYNQLCLNPSHTVAAIKTDGSLWTWGRNQHGELGQNNKTQYSSPKQVGSGTDWDTVQTRHPFMIARKTDGTVWIWGENEKGSLGQNNQTQYSSPIQIPGFTGGEFSNIGVNKDGGNVLKML